MYKIDKDVPVPNDRETMNRKYPFPKMAVGDSVFIPNTNFQDLPYKAASNHASRTGKKFTGRTEGDGIRVWRKK